MMNPFVWATACLLDVIAGDPRWLPHPVAGIGRLIQFLEKMLYSSANQRGEQIIRGSLLVGIVLLIVGGLSVLILFLANQFSALLGLIIAALMMYTCLAARSLSSAAKEIHKLLVEGRLTEARQKLSMIVGRDTENLDEKEIVRATVETVAENIVDGITSPMIYGLLAGPAGAMVYKAINTMDSMLGYKNERYIHFGKCAARLDDIANYIPARFTGWLLILAAMFFGYPAKEMRAAWIKYAKLHPSPNSGITEAVVAGALGVQLGGTNTYQGKQSLRALMGKPLQELKAEHILQAVRLMWGAFYFFAIWSLFLLLGFYGI